MRLRGISLFVIIVISGCLAFGATSWEDYGELSPNNSKDMDVYRVELAGKGYCVPKAYYRWSNSFNDADDVGLNLSLEVASFEAWSLYRVQSEGGRYFNKSSDREVGLIVLDQTLASRQKRWSSLLSLSSKSTTPDGYYRYEGKGNPLVNLDYYLIPQKQADFSWVLGCVSGARCRLEYQLDKNTFYELSFDEQHLGQIKKLEKRVKDFLKRNLCDS